jgi:hypothetical protein
LNILIAFSFSLSEVVLICSFHNWPFEVNWCAYMPCAFGVHVSMQVTEKKSKLAKLEAIDCGKPLDEAAWDIVCL